MGFDIDALIPQERTGDEEPRYILRRGEQRDRPRRPARPARRPSAPPAKRACTITRFKGLGEMNAEELRDTTLDPRTARCCKSAWKTPAAPTNCSAS